MKKIFAIIKAAALSAGIAVAQSPPAVPQPGIVSARAGNPYQRAGQLPARTMDFKAEPASIQPGQKYSFPIEMGLILLGIASQFTIQRKWVMAEDATTRKARFAASLSIMIWTAVGAARGKPFRMSKARFKRRRIL